MPSNIMQVELCASYDVVGSASSNIRNLDASTFILITVHYKYIIVAIVSHFSVIFIQP